MSENEDVILPDYPYAWSPGSDISLENFLNKYRPSMVQNDGTKPWLWVRSPKPSTGDGRIDEAREEASKLLKEVTDKVEVIKNDPTIPIRSNKKTGAKSKKELREEVQSEATEQLTDIAVKNGYVCGKWLIFAPPEKVDMIWSSLASSLVSGPLAGTPAFSAKVATSPREETSNNQHLICIYLPNVYERDSVTEVMRVLLRHHGVNLSGVKSDMYTYIGIYSKHPSGIPSTIWKSSDLLSDSEVKELKDMYFGEVTSNSKAAQIQQLKVDDVAASTKLEPKSKPKPKPKPKKRANDDLFASDDDADEAEENRRKEELQSMKATTQSKRQVDDEVESKPKNKKSKKV